MFLRMLIPTLSLCASVGCNGQREFENWLSDSANYQLIWPANDTTNVAVYATGPNFSSGQPIVIASSKSHTLDALHQALVYKVNNVRTCLRPSATSILTYDGTSTSVSTINSDGSTGTIEIKKGNDSNHTQADVRSGDVNKQIEAANFFKIMPGDLTNDSTYKIELNELSDRAGLKSSGSISFRTQPFASTVNGKPLSAATFSAANFTSGQTATLTALTVVPTNSIQLYIQSPSNKYYTLSASNQTASQTSWTLQFPIQPYHETGQWVVSSIYVGGTNAYGVYQRQNSEWHYRQTISGGSYATLVTSIAVPSFTVSGTVADSVTPVLSLPVITPGAIAAAGNVLLAVTLADPGSGIESASAAICSPTNKYMSANLTFNGGTGKWEGNVAFNGYEETGTYKMCNVYVKDLAGNSAYYHLNTSYSATNFTRVDYVGSTSTTTVTGTVIPTLTATGLGNDTSPPSISSISAVDITAGNAPVISLHVTDNLSGVSSASLTLSGPSYRAQINGAKQKNFFSNTINSNGSIVFNNTSYELYHDPGYWQIDSIYLLDKNANSRTFYSIPGQTNYFYNAGSSAVDSGIAVAGYNMRCE